MSEGEISADAVTGDLKTQGNVLSFWRCTSAKEKDLDDVALAIAAGRNRIAKVEIVWLDDEELRNDGQAMENTNGRTPVTDLITSHVDVIKLDYSRLGKVAHRIASAIVDERYLLRTRNQVKELLVPAIDRDRVNLDVIDQKILDEIQIGS